MAEAGGGSGGAENATVAAQDHAPGDDPLLRAQLLAEEADTAVERIQDKYDKMKAHLEGVRESLDVAKAEQKAAREHLASVRKGGDE